MNEADFIAALRALVTDPAARGLLDDAAVLPARGDIVLTQDMLVEGVHFLSTDPPEDVAWKLLAVNLSDLAGKGATPRGVLLGYTLRGDAAWDAAFVRGLGEGLAAMGTTLLGGDTVACGQGPRVLALTAVGDAPPGGAPARSGARPGDQIWISGTIGDAGAGLRVAQGAVGTNAFLLGRFRRPVPQLALGAAVAPLVSAMMDVSDGLLIDLSRLAAASGVRASIDLDAVPLSVAFRDMEGGGRPAGLTAVTAGDDYELLITAPAQAADALLTAARKVEVRLSQVGTIGVGSGLLIFDAAGAIPLPSRLGYEHG